MSQAEQHRFRAWTRDRLAAPPLELPAAKQQVFEALLTSARQNGSTHFIDYTCAYPKHEFLRYVVDSGQFLLHGSRLLARMRTYPDAWPFGALHDDALYPIRPPILAS